MALVVLLGTLADVHPAHADDVEAAELEPVRVTVPRMERDLYGTPAAITRVDEDRLRESRMGVQLEESLARVPGLVLQNRYNFAQGQRISTRGFGARAPFGVRGIRVRVDGFPETLPDGQSQVDSIDLDSATAIDVLRGPSAVLYGNATGGVIDIHTADGRDRVRGPDVRVDGGSHGLRKLATSAGDVHGRWAWHLSGSLLDYDGYRDQSRVEKRLLNARAAREFDGDREFGVVFSALDLPTAEDPGALNAEQVAAAPRQATVNAVALNAGQQVRQQRVGLSWRDSGTFSGDLVARAFHARRDFEQQLPFPGASLVGFDRAFHGVGLDYSDAAAIGRRPVRYVIGFDADRQVDDRVRHMVDSAGNVGVQTVDERQQATATGVFGQLDVPLADELVLALGLRFDRIRFRIDDHLTDDGDDSGRRSFDEPSSSVGLLWRVGRDHRLYATFSTAFETPTFVEFANPDGSGGFNPDLEPQYAVNREVGARGFLGRDLRYDLSLFSVRTRNEIVSFRLDGNDRDFFENAARTERDGIELGLEHFATDWLTLSVAWTWADYRFGDFTDREGNEFDGNRLPGEPRNVLFAEADWRLPGGGHFTIDARHFGQRYSDNENEREAGSHTLFNARLGRDWRIGEARVLGAWIGVDNVLDEDYLANVRINAGDGFREPGPGRTWYAGLRWQF